MADIQVKGQIRLSFIGPAVGASQLPVPPKRDDFPLDIGIDFSEFNESESGRINLAGGATANLSLGTVTQGKFLIIYPFADLQVSISGGPTSLFKADFPSVMKIDFTSITVTNPTANAIKGLYFVGGD